MIVLIKTILQKTSKELLYISVYLFQYFFSNNDLLVTSQA